MFCRKLGGDAWKMFGCTGELKKREKKKLAKESYLGGI